MKITLSSPDGLGDFILRTPLIRALREEGHLLQIFMRPPAADLAREVFPDAGIEVIGCDPYHPDVKARANPFRREHRAIRRFGPDLYVAALFHLNFFDQVLFEHGPRLKQAAGFACAEEFWAAETTCDPRVVSRNFHLVAEVPGNLPEVEKNRRLAEAILAQPVPEVAPRLAAGERPLDQARALLAQQGLKEGEYLVACVGSRRGLQMKDWGEKNWIAFLKQTGGEKPLLFLGNPAESPSIERIRAQLPSAFHHVNMADCPPNVSVSLALVALSSGYVGRDSGIMHMAAALERPLLAVFGGGHWGRFLPSAGVAVAQAWPCRGCNFYCPYEEPHCIRNVPVASMIEGWRVFQTLPRGELKVLETFADEKKAGLVRTVPAQFARYCQETIRRQQQSLRPANALDALGLRIRTLARMLKS